MTEMETTITSTTALLKIWKDFNLAYVLTRTYFLSFSFFFFSTQTFRSVIRINWIHLNVECRPFHEAWLHIHECAQQFGAIFIHTHIRVRLYEMLIVLSCLVNFSTGKKNQLIPPAQTFPFIEPYREVCNWCLMSTLFYLISNFLLNWNYLP